MSILHKNVMEFFQNSKIIFTLPKKYYTTDHFICINISILLGSILIVLYLHLLL